MATAKIRGKSSAHRPKKSVTKRSTIPLKSAPRRSKKSVTNRVASLVKSSAAKPKTQGPTARGVTALEPETKFDPTLKLGTLPNDQETKDGFAYSGSESGFLTSSSPTPAPAEAVPRAGKEGVEVTEVNPDCAARKAQEVGSAVIKETMKFTNPFQMFWKATLFDIPLAIASESVRFYGRRLQSHGDYLANLNHCRSMPEMIEAHSHFIRKAVDVYGDEPSKMAHGML